MPGGFSWHGFTLSFAFLLSETQRGSDRSHLFFAASASVEKRRSLCPIVARRQLHDFSGSIVGCVGHPHPAYIARGEGSLNR